MMKMDDFSDLSILIAKNEKFKNPKSMAWNIWHTSLPRYRLGHNIWYAHKFSTRVNPGAGIGLYLFTINEC